MVNSIRFACTLFLSGMENTYPWKWKNFKIKFPMMLFLIKSVSFQWPVQYLFGMSISTLNNLNFIFALIHAIKQFTMNPDNFVGVHTFNISPSSKLQIMWYICIHKCIDTQYIIYQYGAFLHKNFLWSSKLHTREITVYLTTLLRGHLGIAIFL